MQSGHSWGVTALASKLGMPKSSVHRLLQALIELGFVQQIDQTKRYTICADIFDFVHEIASHFGRNLSLDDCLRKAAHEFECSVYLSMLGEKDSYAICAAGEEGHTSKLGTHTRAYASSAGKVLIAHFDESEWEKYAPPSDGETITPYTNSDTNRFFAQLKEAREKGIAWNYRESSEELVSLATVIREPFITQPRLAVALLIPYDIFKLRDEHELEQALLSLAADLERKLGQR